MGEFKTNQMANIPVRKKGKTNGDEALIHRKLLANLPYTNLLLDNMVPFYLTNWDCTRPKNIIPYHQNQTQVLFQM